MEESPGAMEGAASASEPVHHGLDITVLMGGPSPEREVSLLSGSAVADALERRGHKVTRADIGPQDTSALDRKGIDVVFIAMHGEFGESGEVQSLCEERSVAYTGSGRHASELAMDKAASKQLFRRAGLATPDWMIVEEWHDPGEVRRWLEEIPPPVVIKPVDGGSSIDITIARDGTARDAAMEELLDVYGRVMLERYVEGRELTVGIVGAQVLPLVEVIPAGDFYDYKAKYADGAGTQYIFEHRLDDPTVEAARAEAMAAHCCLGCRDLSRVDFILDGEGKLQVLELNTIPGFTSHSLVPMAAAKAGVGFEELVDRLVQLAVRRRNSDGDLKQQANYDSEEKIAR